MAVAMKSRIAVPTGSGSIFVDEDQILCCLAEGSYTKMILVDQVTLLVAKNLSKVLRVLAPDQFVRIHKSHFINLAYMKSYNCENGKNTVTLDGDLVLPISRSRKEHFLTYFKSFWFFYDKDYFLTLEHQKTIMNLKSSLVFA